MECFKQNPRWDKDTVDRAARKSGLARAQVYKWGWDRKKKADPDDGDFLRLTKDEFGGYSKHDFIDDDDPIAELLDIDLTKEIKRLGLDYKEDAPLKSVQSISTPKKEDRNLVDTKKRDKKLTGKVTEAKHSSVE